MHTIMAYYIVGKDITYFNRLKFVGWIEELDFLKNKDKIIRKRIITKHNIL